MHKHLLLLVLIYLFVRLCCVLVSSKTGDNVDESMSALVTEVIKKETDIKVVDVSQKISLDNNDVDYDDDYDADSDDDSEMGMSFWAAMGHVDGRQVLQLRQKRCHS